MPVLRPGQTYKEVVLGDGRKAVLRAPEWRDLDGFLALINDLVAERADILRGEKVSRSEEAEWLGKRLTAIEKGSLIALIAEIDGKVVASSDVAQWSANYPETSHVGVLGIAIMRNARGVGLGKVLMKSLIQLARRG